MKEYHINANCSVILSNHTWGKVQRERSNELHHAREIYNTPIDSPLYDAFSAARAEYDLADPFGNHFIDCIVRCTGGAY